MPHQLSRFRRLRGRPALTLTATAIAVAGVAVAPTAMAGATASAIAPIRIDRPVLRQLLLLNGDRLEVRQVGTGQLSSLLPVPDGGQLVTLHLGGATYDVPLDALPYLGHGLDPSLFNRDLLTKLESGGRLQVRVTYRGSLPSLPGITITSRGDGAATGYLTSASARTFGTALFRQFAAQHATGRYGTAGLFAGGASIALAGAPVREPLRPQFPMHTLTVTGTNIHGKPSNGDFILLMNADNDAIFGDPFETENFFFHGTAKYSVPAGHYWAITDFLTVSKHSFGQHLVVDPQFTVTGSRTLHLSASSATSKLTVATPKPATMTFNTLSILRGSKHGFASGTSFSTFGSSPVWISPTRSKPTVGSLQSFTSATLLSPKKDKSAPYAYNASFPGPNGLIPAQKFASTQANTATVHEDFFLNSRQAGQWTTGVGTPAELLGLGLFEVILPIRLPVQQTQFMVGDPSNVWSSSFFEGNFFSGSQLLSDAPRQLQPGSQSTENWNDYPLHPQPFVQLLTGRTARQLPEFPTWFRSGNSLFLEPAPFSDNTPGHTGGAGRSAYTLRQNGKVISHGPYFGGVDVKVSAKPATIAFSVRSSLPKPLSALSAQTATTWTFRTARDSKARLPRSWVCVNERFGASQKCSVPDALSLNYLVKGLDLGGLAPAGPQTINVTVGTAEPAAPSTIVKAGARVSYDSGKFFLPATVTRTGPGQYKVTFTAPPGVDVTTRFSATDSKGSSITETITNGYSVGPQA